MSGELFQVNSTALPALLAVTGDRASMRFLEFFAANIRKLHTRRAYYRARGIFGRAMELLDAPGVLT